MGAGTMSGIFISYRRDDTAGHAGRLFDRLSGTFGADGVFMDVDDIRRGEDFADTLAERLKQSDVLLAVIGRQWLTLTDQAGMRRLDKADDWVRGEISAAICGGLLVVPVLIRGAALPKAADLPADIRALAGRQMADVRDGSWNDDIARLCKDIKRRRSRGSWSEKLREHRMPAAITMSLRPGHQRILGLHLGPQQPRRRASRERPRAGPRDAGHHRRGPETRRGLDARNERLFARLGARAEPGGGNAVRKGTDVALTVAAPKAVDLTRFVTVKDVGQEGTVAAAACAMAMEASLAAQGRPRGSRCATSTRRRSATTRSPPRGRCSRPRCTWRGSSARRRRRDGPTRR